MAKTSKKQIEQDKMKVIDVLEQHSKDSVDKIAKKCGFSRQKVWMIIKDLEKRKIIWGYTAVTDESSRNLKHFIVLFKRTTVPFDENFKKEILHDKLDNYSPNVIIENLYIVHGQYDNVATFYAKDLVSAKKLISAMLEKIGKYYDGYLLLETLLPVRKQRLKNPRMKELVEYM